MKQDKLKSIISDYINEESYDIDLSASVLSKLQSPTPIKRKSLRKPLLIVAMFLVCSTIAYAATIELINLKNISGKTDLEIGIVSDDIKDVGRSDVFSEFKESDIPVDIKNVPNMTIYTKDPTRFITRRAEKYIDDYIGLVSATDMSIYLPETIADFTFSTALIGYEIVMPTPKELSRIAAEHQSENYYTFALETKRCGIEWYEYTYKDIANAVYMVQPTYKPGTRTFNNEHIADYEIVPLHTTEGFLMIRDNMDFSGENRAEMKLNVIKNNYHLFWQDDDYEYSIRSSRTTREYPDPAKRNIYSYPDHTKKYIEILGLEINRLLNLDE